MKKIALLKNEHVEMIGQLNQQKIMFVHNREKLI